MDKKKLLELINKIPKFYQNDLLVDLAELPLLTDEGEEALLLALSLEESLEKNENQSPFPDLGIMTIGDFPLGKVVNSSEGTFFGIDSDELQKHCLIVGQSGSGKTNALFCLILVLLSQSTKCIIFDFKGDFAALSSIFPFTLLLNRQNWKFNPLVPPDRLKADLKAWIAVVADYFADAFGLIASKGYLVTVLHELFSLYGTYDGGPFPNLVNMRDYLKSNHPNRASRIAGYHEACLLKLDILCTLLGNMLDCSEGYSMEALFQLPLVVISFDAMIPEVEDFVAYSFIQSLYHHHKANYIRGNSDVDTVLIIDEASRLFSEYKEKQAVSTPLINIIFQRIREFRVGLVVATQDASIAHSVKANCWTKILFRVADSKDLMNMSASLGLTREQTEVARNLSVGQAIVKSGRLPHPFVIEVPYIPIDKSQIVINEELITQLQSSVVPTISYSEMIYAKHASRKDRKEPNNLTMLNSGF